MSDHDARNEAWRRMELLTADMESQLLPAICLPASLHAIRLRMWLDTDVPSGMSFMIESAGDRSVPAFVVPDSAARAVREFAEKHGSQFGRPVTWIPGDTRRYLSYFVARRRDGTWSVGGGGVAGGDGSDAPCTLSEAPRPVPTSGRAFMVDPAPRYSPVDPEDPRRWWVEGIWTGSGPRCVVEPGGTLSCADGRLIVLDVDSWPEHAALGFRVTPGVWQLLRAELSDGESAMSVVVFRRTQELPTAWHFVAQMSVDPSEEDLPLIEISGPLVWTDGSGFRQLFGVWGRGELAWSYVRDAVQRSYQTTRVDVTPATTDVPFRFAFTDVVVDEGDVWIGLDERGDAVALVIVASLDSMPDP